MLLLGSAAFADTSRYFALAITYWGGQSMRMISKYDNLISGYFRVISNIEI